MSMEFPVASDRCGRCGVAPRGITHICPPPELSGASPALDQALAIPVGPPCPLCGRSDGTHVLGCRVEAYIEGWKELKR